ncbi:putative restriction endonuclease [Arthrobacter sp. UYEF6]
MQLEEHYGQLLNEIDIQLPTSEIPKSAPRPNWKIRVGKTKSYLSDRKLIEETPPGVWRLTPLGRKQITAVDRAEATPTRTREPSGVVYGEIPGYPAPWEFRNRREAFAAGVHRQTQAGISGGASGVDAICLSDGYADDTFGGDLITYTGFGGQDANTRKHISDQQLVRGNLGLVRGYELGRPVRVLVRRSLLTRDRSDASYVYVGLYVVAHWDWGLRDGFKVLIYQLKSLTGQSLADLVQTEIPLGGGAANPERRVYTSTSIVRNYSVAEEIKALYLDTCQVCRTQLRTAAGTYAEAAHIRPLGIPHDGPDVPSNLLCLCPNCHKKFDGHALTIEDDGSLHDLGKRVGVLVQHPRHHIDKQHLAYHRDSSQSQSGGTA